ncbi:dispersed gene family protein 1 (DGF-1) [Trypanosoma grayi]|uniref:dispersed gene family protein 1 (DGF-1) n=1 Tax=Trypanosoma grayi TaxID=71804 RepID=UPI0004F42858|nr:dispersed gene family protein 1 (DGF-1) [Trypanosoma grayi]KEG10670.1 dispersed gene family protein 1 (DGF-1) [Trypanosoma grayi]
MGNQSLELSVSGLSGNFCSLLFAYKLPPHANVTIRDSTIVTAGRMSYTPPRELTNVVTAPLVFYEMALVASQLRVENTVLKSSEKAGTVLYIGGDSDGGGLSLFSSAVVFDSVSMGASASDKNCLMHVKSTSMFSLQSNSVFSLSNASMEGINCAISLGSSLNVSKSVLRFVGIDVKEVSSVLAATGGTIGAGAWLDLRRVWVTGTMSSVASLTGVKLDRAVVSITRCTVAGTTLASLPEQSNSVVYVQCNRVSDKVLKKNYDYRSTGLSTVTVLPCDDSCSEKLTCFAPLTTSFSDCTCKCSSGGVGKTCMPFDVPLVKSGGKQDCMRGVAVTESMTVGDWRANVCFEAVVFSGPITVTVDLRSMNAFVDSLNVTLRHCLLAGGAKLLIKGVDETIARLLPRALVHMTNMTSTNGTIVLQGMLPERSEVLVADSALHAMEKNVQDAVTTVANGADRCSSVLFLDGVRLVSAQLVLTRTTMMCRSKTCATILVERGLHLDRSSSFYMDNCAVNTFGRVMHFPSSGLVVSGGSVVSIQSSSWRMRGSGKYDDAMQCDSIEVKGKSVLQVTGNAFYVGNGVMGMKTLTVEDQSWLLHRDNEIQARYAVNVRTLQLSENGVWSVLRNNFLPGTRPGRATGMLGGYDLKVPNGFTVYGTCNHRIGELVTTYNALRMAMKVNHFDCDRCAPSAECFNPYLKQASTTTTSSSSSNSGSSSSSSIITSRRSNGCKCRCSSGSYGAACLPAPVPTAVGAPVPLLPGAAVIPCVRGGTLDSVDFPAPGVSGLCFVDVTFTAPITIDLGEFRSPVKAINITLLRCTLMGLKVSGADAYSLHMSMTASEMTSGQLVLDEVFGPKTQIHVVDSVVDTDASWGIEFNAEFGVDSMILLRRANVTATMEAVAFMRGFVLNASSIVVQKCQLQAAVPQSTDGAAIRFHMIDIVNGGHLSVAETQMIAGHGILFTHEVTLAKSGQVVIVGNTLRGHRDVNGTALFFRSQNWMISGKSKVRVMGNKVYGASVYAAKEESGGALNVTEQGTVVIFADNEVKDFPDAYLTAVTAVTSSARLLFGCNKKEGKAVTLSQAFGDPKAEMKSFGCRACEASVKCHMPEATSMGDGGACWCKRGEGKTCPPCLPTVAPDTAEIKLSPKPYVTDKTCVVGQTVTNLTLNMRNTHHCYVGVTFNGTGAVATFVLRHMPLQQQINITFTGCTFMGGAGLHFLGSRDAAEAAGVLIRVRRAVMRSSVVSFANALPRGTDIIVTEVDAMQPKIAMMPDRLSNRFAVVVLRNVVLSAASSLLVSYVTSRRGLPDRWEHTSGSGVHSSDSLTLLGGSSLYVQNCTFAGYTDTIYLNGKVRISDHSVLAVLDSVAAAGYNIIHTKEVTVENSSTFRMARNRGHVTYGLSFYNDWNVRLSSWVDWRGNDVSEGPMIFPVSTSVVHIDGKSTLTLTGKQSTAQAFSQPLLGTFEKGYKFITGCLSTVVRDKGKTGAKNKAASQAKSIPNNASIPQTTKIMKCGVCMKESSCFAPLTTAISGCACQCADGGYGDACVPAQPALPPPPPPMPAPPKLDECVSNKAYPEVTQTVGSGLSRLCYRNVVFSGAFMRLTVDVGAMTGDVNITFDGCTWKDGAALVLKGGTTAAKHSLSITITGNTFEDALLSPTGVFPPKTNLIVRGNRFNMTRSIAVPGVATGHTSCIATSGLTLKSHSALTVEENTFVTSGPHAIVVDIGEDGMEVLSHSVFAMRGNTFTLAKKGIAALYVLGNGASKALRVHDHSVLTVERSAVTGALDDFVYFGAVEVSVKSAVLVERNDGLAVQNVFHIKGEVTLRESWVLIHKNAAYDSAVVCRATGNVTMANSRLVVSRNSVSPVARGKPPVVVSFSAAPKSTFGSGGGPLMSAGELASLKLYSLGNWDKMDSFGGFGGLGKPAKPKPIYSVDAHSSLIVACNVVNREVVAEYESVPSAFRIEVMECGAKCHAHASCFPAYTTKTSANGCTCSCKNGGQGDRCLPVDLPGGRAEPCVRDVNMTWDVLAGAGDSAVCFVGVTFAADVVVDVSEMTGSARNVTLKNCTMVGGASLYVVGWKADTPVSERVNVWISGLVSRSGGGVVLANRYPAGSNITIVDSMLIAQTAVAYRSSYNLGGDSAGLVLYNMKLSGSMLTVARTQVSSALDNVAGVLVVGGVALTSGAALYMDRLSAQAALGLCVSVKGDVTVTGGSVLGFVESDFLLCKHAVYMQNAVSVTHSTLTFMRNDFASTNDHAIKFGSTVKLAGNSMLLMKGNTHDSIAKEMLSAVDAVSVEESTLSFARNKGLFPKMLSVKVSLEKGAHMRAACNSIGGSALTTAGEYAAAGFGKAGSIEVVGCDTCDKDTYCYAPGAASATEVGGECKCACSDSGHGEACVPVGGVELPPAPRGPLSSFVLENMTLTSTVAVPRGTTEVALRDLVMDGVHMAIYVPWMANDSVQIAIQNVSLRNGSALYVMGGTTARRAAPANGQRVELSVCSVESFNGVIALTGTFPPESVLTITNSLLITVSSTPLLYLPDSHAAKHAPALILSNLRLVQSVLVVYDVFFLAIGSKVRMVVADGAALELIGGGIALDTVALSGEYAMHVEGKATLSDGSVLHMSESKVYTSHGFVFGKGMSANASALIVRNNTGAVTAGALLGLKQQASFTSNSWLSVRGNNVAGKILSLPKEPAGTNFSHSKLTLYGNTGSGPVMMDGAVTPDPSVKFIVGCLTHNEKRLGPNEYQSAGIVGHTRTVACDTCDTDIKCFAAATDPTLSPSSCNCHCTKGGYGSECLPVHLPRTAGCNRTVSCPSLGVWALKGGNVTLDDIRNVGAEPPRLVVALPPPFRWASDTDLRPYLQFVLTSRPQPTGFSGPWGEMLRNATWGRGSGESLSVLELALPPHESYFVGVDEEILVEYGPRALYGGCTGSMRGLFKVESNTPPRLMRALSVVGGVGAGTSVVAVAVAGGVSLILEAQMFAVFEQMSCVSAHEHASMEALPYFLSPFVDLGPLWMVVGNALIVVVFGCLHFALTFAFQRWRGVDAVSAWVSLRFPALSYIVACLMHPGVFVGSMLMLSMPNAEAQHYVVGVLGALYGVAFPFGVCYFISRHTNAKFMEYSTFSKKSPWVRWLYPAGYWSLPEEQRMYSFIFTSVRGGYVYGCVFGLMVLCLVGVIAGVQPPADKCHAPYFSMAAVLLAAAALMAITNMMRSVFLTVMHTAGFVLLGVVCFINAAWALSPSDDSVRAFAAILLLLVCVVIGTAVYSIGLWYVESRYWKALRETPKLPNGDAAGASAARPAATSDSVEPDSTKIPTEPVV